MSITWTRIKVGDIQIDHTYQRPLDEKRADKIAKAIDLQRIGTIEVSQRGDGSLWGLDGQHRIVGLVRAGKEETRIFCKVHTGLTVAQEAALFLDLNNGRTAPKNFALYNAELAAGHKEAAEIATILKSVGLRANPAKAARSVCAIAAVRAAYRSGNLRETLTVLKSWGGGDARMFDGVLIRAVSRFLADRPEAIASELTEKLRAGEPDPIVLVNRLTAARRMNHNGDKSYSDVMLRVYNARRHKGRLAE